MMARKSYIGNFLIFIFLFSDIAFSQSAFIDATSQAGIDHSYIGYEYGGGVACGDFNNDGYLDLFVPAGPRKQNLLYMNKGDATFEEIAAIAGLADSSISVGTVCGDIDNDGDLDIYLVNFLGENKLYLNDGYANFIDITESAGVGDPGPGLSAALADYNNDGYLDIYVINKSASHSSIFYRNNGDGTFTDVTIETNTSVKGRSLGVGFFDYDIDGDLDLLVVDEFEMDHLFRNNSNGTFTNVTTEASIPETDGMGVDFGDYDNDGDLDIYIGDYYGDPLLRNNGDGTFTEVAAQVGIENFGVGWGVNFMDYDNDGDKDLYVINGAMMMLDLEKPNVFYINNGNGTFSEKGADLGASYEGDGRGSVCADFNRDGYLDIFFVCALRGKSTLLLNKGGNNNWIVLDLVGSISNRSAIGARVEVLAGNLKQIDEVRAGSSYASMHPLELEFGLKKNTLVDTIIIYWPSGIVQKLTSVGVNQILTITEPSEITSVRNLENAVQNVPQKITLFQNFPNPFNPETEIRYQLPKSGQVTLNVINITGQVIQSFKLGMKAAGQYVMQWNGKDRNGLRVPSSVYFYQITLQFNGGLLHSELKKMVLLK